MSKLKICVVLWMLLWAGAVHAGPNSYRQQFPLPSPSVPGSLGVNIHFTTPRPGEVAQLAGAGFKWIRLDFFWAGIERERGKYDFTLYANLLAQLKAAGIRAIFILDYGNDLYEKGSPRSPEAREPFARFAAAAVTRFCGQGIVWEMWNEPNIQFWQPKPNVDEYITLALETGKAIRKAAPEEWFVGPGMSGMDFPFLERCFKAGLLNYWDAVSFHPYRNTPPETAAADFAHVRVLIDTYAPERSHVPIFSSEWGYSELYPGLNRERQGWYIARQSLSNLANGLVISIWYDWHDDGVDPKEPEHHFGTVSTDYREKETYRAIQTLTRTLNGFALNKRLSLPSPDDYCLLFTRGTQTALAVWTSSRTPHSVVLPLGGAKAAIVSYLGKSSVGTSLPNGLTLTLTEAPQYVLPVKPDPRLATAAAWFSLPPFLQVGDLKDEKVLLEASTGSFPAAKGRVSFQKQDGDAAGSVQKTVMTLPVTFSKTIRVPAEINTLVDRSATPRRYRVNLTMPGVQPVAQEILLVSRRPIQMTVLPPVGRTLPIQITNRSGFPFNGRIFVTSGRETREAGGEEQIVPVVFARGEREKLFTVTRNSFNALVGAVLEEPADGGFRPIVTSPPTFFQSFALPGSSNGGEIAIEKPFSVVPDGDPKIDSQIQTSQEMAPAGLPVNGLRAEKIAYDFQPGWKFLRVLPEGKLKAPLAGEPSALGMWVYSDGSGDALRARFTDTTGQTFQPQADNLDWKGWRYVTFSLRDAPGHWGGADDGKVHLPIHLDTLLLIDSPGGRGGKGEIYFTPPTVMWQYPDAGK